MNFFLIMSALFVAPRMELSEQSFDFGHAYVGENYRHTFWVYNRGDESLNIRNIRTFCNCSTTELINTRIAPGDSTSFDFIFDTQGFFGECVKWAWIFSDDPVDSLVKINVTVRLYEDYSRGQLVVEPKYLYFNKIDSLYPEVPLRITNTSQTVYTLRVVEWPRALQTIDFQERTFAPGEEITLKLHPRPDVKDANLFASSIAFEAYTPSEVKRFSVPLRIRRFD